MAKIKRKMDLSIMEAVDNLTSMADLDIEGGKKDRHALFEKLRGEAKWISYQSKKQTDEKIRATFSTIHHYLEHLNQKAAEEEKKVHFQRGVKAIKSLALDAIRKVDGLKQLLHPKEAISSVSEYEEVRDFQKFITEFETSYYDSNLEKEEMEIAGSLYAQSPADLIKEISVLKDDTDYELLFIRREDDLPFFSQEVLEHAKSICHFDEVFFDHVLDNPLRAMTIIQDEEACDVASEIYSKVKTELNPFLKSYKTHQEDTLSQSLYKALIALIAAKNPENLIKTNRQKSCLEYFKDFHRYLSEVTSHQLISRLDQDEYHLKAKKVIQALNGWFFLHPMNHPKAVELVKTLMTKGQMRPIKRHSIWSWFLESYHHLEEEFKKFPSGPIFKLLQQYENGDLDRGFDAIAQGNIPSTILNFDLNEKKRSLLYLPSPTTQSKVSKAAIISNFESFLDLDTTKTFLLFNLQDRKLAAKARTEILEHAEVNHPNLKVVSIPKDTAFYNQESEYFDLDDAASFVKALYDQVQGAPITGFHFPKKMNFDALKKFSQKIIPVIHRQFFASNKILTRKNRLDFIEIFYGFLVFKIMTLLDFDYVSFTCKDAVDIGSLTTLQFFTYLKFFKDPSIQMTDEDHDKLVQIILVPALLQRARLTSYKRVERMLSALSTLEQDHTLSSSEYQTLFELFPKLSVDSINWI